MAVITPKMVGSRIKRREDPRLIQGKATYVDDIKLPGMLHMAFKRSDIAHGVIKSIDLSVAEGMPGVELVITGEPFGPRARPPLPHASPLR